MQKIHVAESLLDIHLLRDQLGALGIETAIRNQYAMGAVGDLAPVDCWPELWVLDDYQAARASEAVKRLLNQLQRDQLRGDWCCSRCGEHNGAAFDCCWNCGCEAAP